MLRAEQRDLWLARVCKSGMYPLSAFGMPLPGPNFKLHAESLGDDSVISDVKIKTPPKAEGKKPGTKTVTTLTRAGDVLSDLYQRALREPGFTLPIHMRGGVTKTVTFVPGHIWGQHIDSYANSSYSGNAIPVDGPHPAKVMVIGKMPWRRETEELRNLLDATGEILVTYLRDRLKIEGINDWYVTNLVKFMPPDESTTIKSAYLKDCLPLLHQELRIVKPKYILCLGADATKALLGNKYSVSYMDGRVIEYTYPTGLHENDPQPHTALVMSVIHPVNITRDEALGRQLERGLARFGMLQRGIRFDKAESDIDHRVISDLDELWATLLEAEHDPAKKDSVIGVDAEWQGEHPVNKGSYLRTVQFAWLPKKAACIKLRGVGGIRSFVDAEGKPAEKRAIAMLRAFFKGQKLNGVKFRRKRVVGHFFNSDLEWLVANGLDIQDEFLVPLYDLNVKDPNQPERLRQLYRKKGYKGRVPAWVRTRYEGGGDTGLRAHAIEESTSYGLEALAMRYTTAPRYDVQISDWITAYCKEHNLKAGQLEGFGNCPDHILCPTAEEREQYKTHNYACYDADVTLRIWYEQEKLLDCDYQGNCCREAFWENQIATPAVLEIHTNGILLDRKRVDYLTEKFIDARKRQEKKIKDWSRWPEFNIRSVQHVKEFLFGAKLNGKVTKDGKPIRIRPPAGRSLKLQPLLNTSKPPKQWAEIVEQGKENEHSPSTNKTVLSIMAQENPDEATQINWIRDYRFLDQVLKTVLRPPREDDEGNWLYEPDPFDTGGGAEQLIYDAGLCSVICDDGRVRTHIYQTKETGRWASARPNLQNMSKQRDPDYVRLLGGEKNAKGKWVGGDYKFPLRSVFKASPGHVLLEADYIGAELYGMAIMSGDPTMIDHATRNQLDEDDPNYYDIHSNVAVMAFSLDCKPTKKGLDEIGKAHLRIIAKNVIFGIAYGRGAKAIALAAKEQGIKISVDDAQKVIDTIFVMYPGLVPFFDEAKQRSAKARWICHCFGRFRRFPFTNDKTLRAEFERQAMNFPIQGMIASAVDRAIAYLWDYKRNCGNPKLFRILLQIHDAILLEVPYEHVEFVAEQVLPWAMRDQVAIYPTRLDGRPTDVGPYRLGIDAEVMLHWGEKLKADQAAEIGLTKSKYSRPGVKVSYFTSA